MRQFGSYLPLVLKGELRGANPSTRGLGWVNLWCTGCYANSSAGQLSWYGRTAAPREILLYTSSRTRFLNRTSIGERCKHREVWSDLVLNEFHSKKWSRTGSLPLKWSPHFNVSHIISFRNDWPVPVTRGPSIVCPYHPFLCPYHLVILRNWASGFNRIS